MASVVQRCPAEKTLLRVHTVALPDNAPNVTTFDTASTLQAAHHSRQAKTSPLNFFFSSRSARPGDHIGSCALGI
jgi:hypothetical protein